MADMYQIRVGGHLDDRWLDWLGGLAIQRQADGTTLLVGTVVDQSALHGVIACIRNLALPLLSIERVESNEEIAPGIQRHIELES
jgi:hypothetical protein